MSNVIMFGILIIVIASSFGVFFWFTKRLNRIEEELWGEKRREAEKVALETDSAASAENSGSENTE